MHGLLSSLVFSRLTPSISSGAHWESFPLPVFYFYNLAFISSSYSIWLGAEARLAQKADATRRASAHQEMSEFQRVESHSAGPSWLLPSQPPLPCRWKGLLSLLSAISGLFLQHLLLQPLVTSLGSLDMFWLASPLNETCIDHVEACLSYNASSVVDIRKPSSNWIKPKRMTGSQNWKCIQKYVGIRMGLIQGHNDITKDLVSFIFSYMEYYQFRVKAAELGSAVQFMQITPSSTYSFPKE